MWQTLENVCDCRESPKYQDDNSFHIIPGRDLYFNSILNNECCIVRSESIQPKFTVVQVLDPHFEFVKLDFILLMHFASEKRFVVTTNGIELEPCKYNFLTLVANMCNMWMDFPIVEHPDYVLATRLPRRASIKTKIKFELKKALARRATVHNESVGDRSRGKKSWDGNNS